MKIGLWSDSHHFPSLPLMKLSAYHKQYGDDVEMWKDTAHYDIVYISKVFTESEVPSISNALKVVRGGSGYDLKNALPKDIEHIYPDYTLYPDCKFALGFLTRGCPRLNHTFCITPQKDGCVSKKVANLSEFWRGQNDIVLLDQNLLACKDRINLLGQLANSKSYVDFVGGMDIRYMNDAIINALRHIKTKHYHFAWDDPKENLFDKFKLFANSRITNLNNVTVYVLTNYWSTHEEDLHRIYTLRSLGYMPFVMIYDKQKFVDSRGRWLSDDKMTYAPEQLKHFKVCQHMQRWCNSRRIIKTVPRFEDYSNYRRWIDKGEKVPAIRVKGENNELDQRK